MKKPVSTKLSEKNSHPFFVFLFFVLIVFLGIRLNSYSGNTEIVGDVLGDSEIVSPEATLSPPTSEEDLNYCPQCGGAGEVKGFTLLSSGSCPADQAVDSYEYLCKPDSVSVDMNDAGTSGGSNEGDVVTLTKDCKIAVEEITRPYFENGGDLNGDGLIQIEYGEWPSYSDYASGGGTNNAEFRSGESYPSSEGRLTGCEYAAPGCDSDTDGSDAVKYETTMVFSEKVPEADHGAESSTDDCKDNPPASTTTYECKSPKLSEEMSPTAVGRYIAPTDDLPIEEDVMNNDCDRLSPSDRVPGTSEGTCFSDFGFGGWLGLFQKNERVSSWDKIVDGVQQFFIGVRCLIEGNCSKGVTIKIMIKKSPTYVMDNKVTVTKAPQDLPDAAGNYEDTLVQTDCYVNACGNSGVKASCVYVDYRVPAWEDFMDDNYCRESHPLVMDSSGNLVEDYRYNTCILSDYISYVNNTIDRCIDVIEDGASPKSSLEVDICKRVLGK